MVQSGKVELLNRPSLQVVLPQVKLNLQDLAYLRSVSQEKSVRCHPSGRVVDKLRFLDLIARAKVPPSRETVNQVNSDRADMVERLNTAIHKQDWSSVSNLGYNLQRLEGKLAPIEDDVLTKKGMALLRTGEANVRVRKVGCV